MFFQQKRLLRSKILRETTAFSEEQKIKYAAGLEEAYMSSDHTASENSSQDELALWWGVRSGGECCKTYSFGSEGAAMADLWAQKAHAESWPKGVKANKDLLYYIWLQSNTDFYFYAYSNMELY